jgi:IclR helix-turn-helix domain
MSAEVIDLAAVRAAAPVASMTLAEIDAEVQAIRVELVRPLQRLARLRAAGAHLTAFGPDTAWHDAVAWWLGDLTALRLSGSPEAVAEREALIWSLREGGAATRAIRERLGVSSGVVSEALRRWDPAPDQITSADGRTMRSRTGRAEPQTPAGRKWQQADRLLRAAPEGLTIASLARAGGWSEGSASGLLSDLLRRGLAVRSEERRDGMRVHRAVTP